MFETISPIPCRGGQIWPPSSFQVMAKNYWFDWFETFWQFLNNHFTHFMFTKIFSRTPPSPTFWVPQRILCGGGGSDLTPGFSISWNPGRWRICPQIRLRKMVQIKIPKLQNYDELTQKLGNFQDLTKIPKSSLPKVQFLLSKSNSRILLPEN